MRILMHRASFIIMVRMSIGYHNKPMILSSKERHSLEMDYETVSISKALNQACLWPYGPRPQMVADPCYSPSSIVYFSIKKAIQQSQSKHKLSISLIQKFLTFIAFINKRLALFNVFLYVLPCVSDYHIIRVLNRDPPKDQWKKIIVHLDARGCRIFSW